MEFKPSKPFTVGIELELQLVDRESFELVDRADVIFSELGSLKGMVHPEFLRSMVEVVTPPSSHPGEAVEHVRFVLGRILEISEDYGFTVVALGTHPFAEPSKVSMTESERYLRLLDELQVVLKNFLIYGLHVHVGIPDELLSIKAYNLTLNFLPIFLALSTSSPFFAGRFTGLHSFRTKIFEMLPRSGIPEYLESFEQFEELIGILKSSGTIESLKDVWWDVRLRPDFGTLELRVCDAVPQMGRIEAIASLFQALCSFSRFADFDRTYMEVLRQNKWNATRYSFDGRFIVDGRARRIGDVAFELVDLMERKGIFRSLGTSPELVRRFILEKPVSEVMIERFFAGNDPVCLTKVGEVVL